MNTRNLLFIDLETTGLDEDKHEIVEVAWLLTEPDGIKILSKGGFDVMPLHVENADPKALEVNGYEYNPYARMPADTAGKLADLTSGRILAGHGVDFDERFLRALFKRYRASVGWHYQSVDTQKMAWPLLLANKIPSVSLRHVAPYLLGKHQVTPHKAFHDIRLTHEVYVKMMQMAGILP